MRVREATRRFWLAVGVLIALLAVAGPASAHWRKAESERFIVYSEGGAGQLTTFVQKLETFDRLLRWRMGLDVNAAPPRKLPIFLVDNESGILRIEPDIGGGVGGFYDAREEDIFAVAIRGEEGDDVLLHEYAHHFMLQNFPYGYPAWFIEGFAEYFATVEIKPDQILIGKYNENRAGWLRGASWLSMNSLLAKRYGEARRHNETFYPVSWLLTHWFLGNESRRDQLNAYLLDVGAGGDGAEAMERATGMSNGDLRRALRRYMGSIPYYGISNVFPPVAVTITELPPSADDLLLYAQRLSQPVPEARRSATVAEVRRLAARYPDDSFARLTLGHAELRAGDRAAGEAVLRALLVAEPDNVPALQYLAGSLMVRAGEAGADPLPLKAEARALLARAYQLDDANYRTFMLLADLRKGSPGYPNDNDLATRELALQLAPQLDRARLDLAEAYLDAGRNADAIRTAEPLANSPHGDKEAKAAQALIDRGRGLTTEQAAAEAAAADAEDAPDDPPPPQTPPAA